VALNALLALAYFVAAKLGLTLAFETPSVTAIWPPAGIALAALVLGGRRLWPGVALGAFLANVTTDVPVYTAAGITVGNTLAAVTGAYLLERVGFRPALKRLRHLFGLVVLAGLVSTMVSATIGVASLGLGDALHDDALSVWRVWWLGDMGGDLLIGSLLLVAVTHWPYRDAPGHGFEVAALAGGLIALTIIIFRGDSALAYLAFPFLIWAGLRFWQPGAVGAALIAAVIAVAFTANGEGQFVESSEDESLLLALLFSLVGWLTAMVLAIATRQRTEAETAVRNVAQTLQHELLPPLLPSMTKLEAAAWYRPAEASQEVGGDFYDVFETGGGHWIAVIGDVCGKGPEAASLTALARHTVRALAPSRIAPSEILRRLNRTILEQRSDRRFMTVALAQIAIEDGAHRLTISNGGHPLPLLVRADGEVSAVGRPGAGALLGIMPQPPLGDVQVTLRPGDALILFTDGLVEDPSDPERGQDWIWELLSRSGSESAEAIVDRLRAAQLERAGGHDDVAVLVLRRS
jgi:integral membrane sensor domain MASE1